MNMTLGCREEVGKAWFYYLMDGTKLTKEEWTSIVKRNVKEKGHEAVLDKIKSTIKLWNHKDSIEEVALHVYAGQYCTEVQQVARREKASIKPIIGTSRKSCEQLTLIQI